MGGDAASAVRPYGPGHGRVRRRPLLWPRAPGPCRTPTAGRPMTQPASSFAAMRRALELGPPRCRFAPTWAGGGRAVALDAAVVAEGFHRGHWPAARRGRRADWPATCLRAARPPSSPPRAPVITPGAPGRWRRCSPPAWRRAWWWPSLTNPVAAGAGGCAAGVEVETGLRRRAGRGAQPGFDVVTHGRPFWSSAPPYR